MILVNGVATDAVPVTDRGLAYGDGLFETMRARNGRLPLLDYHLERLYRGLQVLGFAGVPRDTLIAELHIAAASVPDGVLKLIITRGSGNRGYAIPAETETRRIVIAGEFPEHIAAWNENGISLRFCSTVLEGPHALDGLKHLNRLAQVLARGEWRDPDIQEGLMRDVGGNIVEGT
ncbi:MAG: aminodeoxychorismate lyase, partial [Proteobacteria bacterium]|nr:aminodeoxychorismate lyase [Pseudomonadota bacterium]